MASKPTAQEAYDKLKGHVGNLGFFLSPAEIKALEAAVKPATKKVAKAK